MKPERRRQVIANFLEHDGPQTVRALAARMSIEPSTVERDLHEMLDHGRVARAQVKGWRGGRWGGPRYTWELVA